MDQPGDAEQPPPQQPWGRLLRLGAGEGEPHVLLRKREWTIGRRRGCDLSFPGNKLVSGDHCKIIVDEKSGQVSLEDTSTNGTVINKLKVVKKQTCPLQTGDVIYLVYRKNEPEHNVAYLYESLNEKQGITQDSFGSRDAGISPKECGPCVAGDEIPTFPSALPDREGASFSMSESRDQEDLEPMRKRMKGDGEPDLTLQLLVADQCGDTHSTLGNVRSEAVKPDKMEETLTCIICQDLLHDCVSLQPCMHTFCAACYSGWMERSTLCPTCRCPVERICKNHILNNLVEAYLLQHPDKSRSEEDVRSMAARNKITQDMLQPKVRRSFSDEEGSSEDLLELSDVDSESSDVSQPYIVCRQCPEYRRQAGQSLPCPGPGSEPGSAPAPGEAPSTSTSVTTAQDYVCALQGSHAICTCCFQPMPDRRAEREQDPRIAPQQCAVCRQPFCHLYWGCARAGCLGCLAPFCELDLGDRCLDGVLSNNHYESDVLKNYLATRGLTWKNMLTESLVALQRGAFLLSDHRVTGNTVLCYCCGLRSFRELTYQYRQSIPASELPVAVTSRPDCYWGRNCRTQVKAHHAMKFNHICEQTRFKN
ncbi:E3 ubiquitin-protein ligase CHFR isoform X4 [Mirounga angustirostris]|uniref:E3 ubiquitin-protein ligase CHFR isoform X3 n=1 Tax=Mirounga leonina TaxID=9715 RepID=UPI00156C316F|nr:E3 ubiquitin-protein ligase CHFR isoform X3 [Mirounga leonina]XP_045743843.1 E3 ubiquitin-protein ligase CHFR isoform X3 [Mirounga angustirostris]